MPRDHPDSHPAQGLLAELEQRMDGEQEERSRQEHELAAATANKEELAAQVRHALVVCSWLHASAGSRVGCMQLPACRAPQSAHFPLHPQAESLAQQLQATKTAAAAEAARLREQLEAKSASLAALEAEAAATQQQLEEQRTELAVAHARLAALQAEYGSAQDELAAARQEAGAAREEASAARSEAVAKADSCENLGRRATELMAQLAAARAAEEAQRGSMAGVCARWGL